MWLCRRAIADPDKLDATLVGHRPNFIRRCKALLLQLHGDGSSQSIDPTDLRRSQPVRQPCGSSRRRLRSQPHLSRPGLTKAQTATLSTSAASCPASDQRSPSATRHQHRALGRTRTRACVARAGTEPTAAAITARRRAVSAPRRALDHASRGHDGAVAALPSSVTQAPGAPRPLGSCVNVGRLQ